MFPFSLFKKKKVEIPVEDYGQQGQPNFNQQFPQQNFRDPFQNQNSGSGSFERNLDNSLRDDLVISKLETINAKLDNVIQRLERIERMAKE
ncbi:MAG: hypothetical protein V1663_02015 [archaeon]